MIGKRKTSKTIAKEEIDLFDSKIQVYACIVFAEIHVLFVIAHAGTY